MAKKRLTPKQKDFVEEYLIDFNATRAAIEAGYSKKTATVIACENLIKPNVVEYLQKRKAQILRSKESTPEKVIERVVNRSVSNIKDYYEETEQEFMVADEKGVLTVELKPVIQLIPPTRLSKEAAARVKSISITKDGQPKYELYSAHASDELLAKYHNLFPNKMEHSGPDGQPIKMETEFTVNFIKNPKKE